MQIKLKQKTGAAAVRKFPVWTGEHATDTSLGCSHLL